MEGTTQNDTRKRRRQNQQEKQEKQKPQQQRQLRQSKDAVLSTDRYTNEPLRPQDTFIAKPYKLQPPLSNFMLPRKPEAGSRMHSFKVKMARIKKPEPVIEPVNVTFRTRRNRHGDPQVFDDDLSVISVNSSSTFGRFDRFYPPVNKRARPSDSQHTLEPVSQQALESNNQQTQQMLDSPSSFRYGTQYTQTAQHIIDTDTQPMVNTGTALPYPDTQQWIHHDSSQQTLQSSSLPPTNDEPFESSMDWEIHAEEPPSDMGNLLLKNQESNWTTDNNTSIQQQSLQAVTPNTTDRVKDRKGKQVASYQQTFNNKSSPPQQNDITKSPPPQQANSTKSPPPQQANITKSPPPQQANISKSPLSQQANITKSPPPQQADNNAYPPPLQTDIITSPPPVDINTNKRPSSKLTDKLQTTKTPVTNSDGKAQSKFVKSQPPDTTDTKVNRTTQVKSPDNTSLSVPIQDQKAASKPKEQAPESSTSHGKAAKDNVHGHAYDDDDDIYFDYMVANDNDSTVDHEINVDNKFDVNKKADYDIDSNSKRKRPMAAIERIDPHDNLTRKLRDKTSHIKMFPVSTLRSLFLSGLPPGTVLQPKTIDNIEDAVRCYFEQLREDLTVYADHSDNSKTIDEKDIKLLMKRQRLLHSDDDLEVLAHGNLPREYWDQLCVSAMGHNHLFPKYRR